MNNLDENIGLFDLDEVRKAMETAKARRPNEELRLT